MAPLSCLRLVFRSDILHLEYKETSRCKFLFVIVLSTKDALLTKQIENEYGNNGIESSYGPRAKPYINWAAAMATSLDTGVPWVMCQQPDAPASVVSFSCLTLCLIGRKSTMRTSLDYPTLQFVQVAAK